MDSWLDRLPSHERERIRKRLRSPEAYEKLREKVKGPEDLEREMERNEALAELRFGMETEPLLKKALEKQIERDLQERGIGEVIDGNVSLAIAQILDEGRFTVTVEAHPETHEDTLVVLPEGRVAEKLPLKRTVSNRYLAQFVRGT